MNMKKIFAIILAAGLLLTAVPGVAEDTLNADAATLGLTAADSQKLDASYNLALKAISAEDYDTAKEYLNICFVYCNPQANPTMYADLLMKRACIDVIEQKYDMALLQLDAALRIQPDLPDVYLVRTQVYSAQGALSDAIENLEKYISLTNDATLYETVALLQEANGNAIAAQEAYDKFAAAAGEDNKDVLFNAAHYRMKNGMYADAAEAFQAFAEDEVYGAGALFNIGACKMNLGDLAGAIESFTACAEKGGTFEGLYYYRGLCYLLSENWEKAAEDFTKSIETENIGDDVIYNLGICKMQQEDYEAALANFNEVVTKAEADEAELNDAVFFFRGVTNAALGNLQEALADLTICVDHGYELAQSYYQRAQVYAALGDTENQQKDLENFIKY